MPERRKEKIQNYIRIICSFKMLSINLIEQEMKPLDGIGNYIGRSVNGRMVWMSMEVDFVQCI